MSSVIGYTDLADAVRLAARGGGSLVASVCTNDPAVAQQLVTGIAAHHGRVLMLNREDARSSTGHGSPVPHLVHGGPGRAGGGEELGGIRSVMHHMQRTAIQGSPNMLTAVTGRLAHRRGPQLHARDRGPAPVPEVPGHAAHRRRHPLGAARGLAGGDHQVRQLHRRHLLRPHQPGSRRGQPVLPGHRGARLPAARPGPPACSWSPRRARSWPTTAWRTCASSPPWPPGDSIRVTLTAKKITPRETDEYGEVAWDAVLTNQNDEIVATYDVLTLVEK